MWYYIEGIINYDLIWLWYGIWIILGLLLLWLDVVGKWLLVLLFFGFDIFGILEYIIKFGYDYIWFVLNVKIIEKEFVLFGQEQNFDLIGWCLGQLLCFWVYVGLFGLVQVFIDCGVDCVYVNLLCELVVVMNELFDVVLLDYEMVVVVVIVCDCEVVNKYSKDGQIIVICVVCCY